ncbi:MAG: hypothetical protein ACI4DU_01975 [Lachnospiraceae bacterium]
MKRIWNRSLILLLLMSIVLCLAGCSFQTGNSEDYAENENADAVSQTDPQAGTQAGEDADLAESMQAGEGITSSSSIEELSIVADISSAQGELDKVNWILQENWEPYDGIVTSVGILYEYDEYNMVVAFTNLYDAPVAIKADMYALDTDGNLIGNAILDTGSIASAGGTVLEVIPCGSSIPDGRINYDECSIEVVSPDTHTLWATEFSGSLGNGGLYMEYYIEPEEDKDLCPGWIWVLPVDSGGNIMGYYCNYISDVVPAGYQNYYDFVIDSDSVNTQNISDVACFVQGCE